MISVFRYQTSLVAQTVKRLPTSGRPRFDPWVGKILWRRKWQPTVVLLSGKSHGRRSLVGYSPWGCKQSDTTEQLHFHLFSRSFSGSSAVKDLSACDAGNTGSIPPWVSNIPWRRKWQSTLVFLHGNSTDREIWQTAAHGVIENQTRRSD